MKPDVSKAIVVVLALTAGAILLGILLHEPEEVRVRVLSEYRCHPEFQPFDIAFQAKGTLYSSGSSGNAVFRHAPNCLQVAGHGSAGQKVKWITGITSTPEEQICFAALSERVPLPPMWIPDPDSHLTEEETETFYHTRVFCWENQAALGLIPDVRINSIPDHYPFGMTSNNEGKYLAAWLGEHGSFDRGAILVIQDKEIMDDIDLGDWAPLFLHATAENGLFITALSGVHPSLQPNQVIHSAEGGAILHLKDDTLSTLVSGLEYPTGIVAIERHIFVADYWTGQLLAYTTSGQLVGALDGFEGPMGMTLAPDGRICVAEMDGARITCLDVSAVMNGD